MLKAIGAYVGTILIALALVFGVSFVGYELYAFFAPRYTAVDAKVFKESVQYNEGMVRDLENLKIEYYHSDDAGKQALRPIILHRFQVYDRNRLPADLQQFYNQVEGLLP